MLLGAGVARAEPTFKPGETLRGEHLRVCPLDLQTAYAQANKLWEYAQAPADPLNESQRWILPTCLVLFADVVVDKPEPTISSFVTWTPAAKDGGPYWADVVIMDGVMRRRVNFDYVLATVRYYKVGFRNPADGKWYDGYAAIADQPMMLTYSKSAPTR